MAYTISDYNDMIADRVRMDAYAAALARHITPDTTVLDIGCGSGIFSLLACRLGAKRVIAIDPNPAIYVGRQLAEANGVADRIEFHPCNSHAVSLDDKADLLVSDLRGALPIYGKHFQIVADARRRLLKPDAVILPRRDTLYVALVSCPNEYSHARRPWGEHDFGLNLEAAEERTVNLWTTPFLKKEHVIVPPQLWVELDYTSDVQKQFIGRMTWTIESPATFHGAYLWFDCELCDGITYSASPYAAKRPQVYGNGLFPLPCPTDVRPGDLVTVDLCARGVDQDFIWEWSTIVCDAQGLERCRYHQSTLANDITSPAELKRRAQSHRPELNEDGRIDLEILRGMSQGNALGDIARHIASLFPARYPTWQQAMGRVGDIAVCYEEISDAPVR